MKNYLKSIFLFSLLFFNCQSNDNDSNDTQLAIIDSETTIENAEITFTSVKVHGNITSNGGSIITEKGVCWSTSPKPTIENEISLESTDSFLITIDNLIANTNYYFRVFATNDTGTSYGPELSIRTLTLADTDWTFTTIYSAPYAPIGEDFELFSEVNIYNDNTTKFDELDLPLHCPGCFITYGSWSLEGNNLTYIWEGNNESTSPYTYTGILNEMSLEGVYTRPISEDIGEWNAVLR